MQNAAGGGASVPSDDRIEGYRAGVSDLASLIERVRESLKLLDAAIASELPPGDQNVSANVVVLDDVTPRYCAARTDAERRRRGSAARFGLSAG